LNGIFWVLPSGALWRDLPDSFAAWGGPIAGHPGVKS
ncbi:MAG: transposase, partial [Mesorhizobium sp.]